MLFAMVKLFVPGNKEEVGVGNSGYNVWVHILQDTLPWWYLIPFLVRTARITIRVNFY